MSMDCELSMHNDALWYNWYKRPRDRNLSHLAHIMDETKRRQIWNVHWHVANFDSFTAHALRQASAQACTGTISFLVHTTRPLIYSRRHDITLTRQDHTRDFLLS